MMKITKDQQHDINPLASQRSRELMKPFEFSERPKQDYSTFKNTTPRKDN
jgi:hypothetical protein